MQFSQVVMTWMEACKGHCDDSDESDDDDSDEKSDDDDDFDKRNG